MYAKIKALMDSQNISAYKLSKDLGFSRSMFSDWKAGRSVPKASTLSKIADYFHVPLAYFYVDDPEAVMSVFTDDSERLEPVYDCAAGQGRINDAPTEHIHAEHSDEYSYIRIHGDSMLPELRDGDLVKVHHVAEDVTPNDFSVVKIDGETATIKFVEFTDGGMWLRASNKEVFEDTFYEARKIATYPVKVIGKAVAIVERML